MTAPVLPAAQTSNAEVHDAIVDPLVRTAMLGGCATLLAYGQTGSGKTFTISGAQAQSSPASPRRA
jgi:hypothetical protein